MAAPGWSSGQRVGVQWEAGAEWQVRVLLCGASRDEYEDVMTEAPPATAKRGAELWYAWSSDDDVYPHCLDATTLRGACALDERNRPDRAQRVGIGPPAVTVYHGGDWHPTPQEFAAALSFALDFPFADTTLPSPSTSPPKKAQLTLPGAPASVTTLPLETELVSGSLPDASPKSWKVIAATTQTPLTDSAVDYAVVAEGMALAKKGTTFYLMRAVVGDEDLDARVLPLQGTTRDGRHRPFREAVRFISETAWPRWPFTGPRTTKWCMSFISEQDVAPRSRHAKWKAECGLASADASVSDHELCMRFF